MSDTIAPPQHPRDPLSYPDAIRYVENWLTESHLTEQDRDRGFRWHVYDYHDGDPAKLKDRPWAGVRVSEVDVSCPTGGGSYMQVDMPWGVAVCGQVERCILALVEGWNQNPYIPSAGDPWYDTDDEFWRLTNLLEEAEKTA